MLNAEPGDNPNPFCETSRPEFLPVMMGCCWMGPPTGDTDSTFDDLPWDFSRDGWLVGLEEEGIPLWYWVDLRELPVSLIDSLLLV